MLGTQLSRPSGSQSYFGIVLAKAFDVSSVDSTAPSVACSSDTCYYSFPDRHHNHYQVLAVSTGHFYLHDLKASASYLAHQRPDHLAMAYQLAEVLLVKVRDQAGCKSM